MQQCLLIYHCISYESLNFILAYFYNQKQKTKIGSSFSDVRNILFGVPQVSILAPFLFIIYICDLFKEYDAIEFDNYADDITPYTYGRSCDEIIKKLEKDMSKICEWFHHNGFKANPRKSFFIKLIRRQTNKNNGICYSKQRGGAIRSEN